MTVKEMRAAFGLSQIEFAEKYKIPRRTLEDWERGKSNAPEYVRELLERAVVQDLDKTK